MILVRAASSTWSVAAASESDLLLGGRTCDVRLDDLDGDGLQEILVSVEEGSQDTLWAFSWTRGLLSNQTPTVPGGAGRESLWGWPTIADLGHDGSKEVFVRQEQRDPGTAGTLPGILYVKDTTGWHADPECRDLRHVRYGDSTVHPIRFDNAGVDYAVDIRDRRLSTYPVVEARPLF